MSLTSVDLAICIFLPVPRSKGYHWTFGHHFYFFKDDLLPPFVGQLEFSVIYPVAGNLNSINGWQICKLVRAEGCVQRSRKMSVYSYVPKNRARRLVKSFEVDQQN